MSISTPSKQKENFWLVKQTKLPNRFTSWLWVSAEIWTWPYTFNPVIISTRKRNVILQKKWQAANNWCQVEWSAIKTVHCRCRKQNLSIITSFFLPSYSYSGALQSRDLHKPKWIARDSTEWHGLYYRSYVWYDSSYFFVLQWLLYSESLY